LPFKKEEKVEGLRKVGFEYIEHKTVKKNDHEKFCRFCDENLLQKRKVRIRGHLLKFDHKTITIWSCGSCWGSNRDALKRGFDPSINSVRFIMDEEKPKKLVL